MMLRMKSLVRTSTILERDTQNRSIQKDLVSLKMSMEVLKQQEASQKVQAEK